jgi:hypothetical protein
VDADRAVFKREITALRGRDECFIARSIGSAVGVGVNAAASVAVLVGVGVLVFLGFGRSQSKQTQREKRISYNFRVQLQNKSCACKLHSIGMPRAPFCARHQLTARAPCAILRVL